MDQIGLLDGVDIEHYLVDEFLLIFETDFMVVEVDLGPGDHGVELEGEFCVLVVKGRGELVVEGSGVVPLIKEGVLLEIEVGLFDIE